MYKFLLSHSYIFFIHPHISILKNKKKFLRCHLMYTRMYLWYQHHHHSHAIFNSYIFFRCVIIIVHVRVVHREYHHHFWYTTTKYHFSVYPSSCPYCMYHRYEDNFRKLKKAPQRPDNMGVVLYWYHSALLFFIYIIHPYSRTCVCIWILSCNNNL